MVLKIGTKCKSCNGTKTRYVTCDACGGKGKIRSYVCGQCSGRKVISIPCPVCKGSGRGW